MEKPKTEKRGNQVKHNYDYSYIRHFLETCQEAENACEIEFISEMYKVDKFNIYIEPELSYHIPDFGFDGHPIDNRKEIELLVAKTRGLIVCYKYNLDIKLILNNCDYSDPFYRNWNPGRCDSKVLGPFDWRLWAFDRLCEMDKWKIEKPKKETEKQ